MNTYRIKKMVLGALLVVGLGAAQSVAAQNFAGRTGVIVRGGGDIHAGQQHFAAQQNGIGHQVYVGHRDRENRRSWGWWGLGVGLGAGYPYYAATQPGYSVPSTVVIINNADTPSTLYYCDSAGGYYPYVDQCAEPWRPVQVVP